MHASPCRPRRKREKGIVSTWCISWSWKEGGRCGFASAPIAGTNKSGGDFYPCMYRWCYRGGDVDAHSEYKPLLIQNDMTQAPFLPLLQAHWFSNSPVWCLLHEHWPTYSAYGWERLNRTPELRTAAVEMDAAQIKANREGFTFTTPSARLQWGSCRNYKWNIFGWKVQTLGTWLRQRRELKWWY